MRETELQTPQRHSQPKKFTAWFVHSLNEVESLPFKYYTRLEASKIPQVLSL